MAEASGTSLNKALRQLREDHPELVNHIEKDATVKAFRVGKLSDISDNPSVELSLLYCMIRGKWQDKMKEMFTVLEYWYETVVFAVRAARAGNGWRNCRQKVYIPSFGGLFTDAETKTIEDLCFVLCHLHGHFNYTAEVTSHWKFICHRMFVTFLMHIEEFIDKYTTSHVVVITLLKHASKVTNPATQGTVTLDTLKGWGAVIKKDWKTKNCSQIESFEDVKPALETITLQLASMKLDNSQVLSIRHLRCQTNSTLVF